MSQNLHVVTHDEDGWAVKREGNSSPVSTHETQKDAISEALDSAGDDDVNVIVHRRDGRIREVRSTENGAEDGAASSNQSRQRQKESAVVAPSASLGSRVRWGAVLAGFFVSVASSLTLTALGIALALCLANVLAADWLSVFAGVWVMFTILVSLFVGGLVISRLTVGESEILEPSVYGILLWSLVFLVLPLMPLTATNVGFGALSVHIEQAQQTDAASTEEDLAKAGLTAGHAETVSKLAEPPANATAWVRGNATEIAWLSFVALVLSLGAAVFGAITGAAMDEEHLLTQKRTT